MQSLAVEGMYPSVDVGEELAMTTAAARKPVGTDPNRQLVEASSQYVPGGLHTAIRVIDPPLCIRRSKGAYLWDVADKRYIDYHAAFAPIILGHCYPDVVEKVVETVQTTDLYGVSTTELELELSKKIVRHLPSVQQVLLCCTGSEATFHAVRLSRAVTGRRKIIKFQGCYHGWHDYVLRNVISSSNLVNGRDPGSAGMLDEAVDNTLVCVFNDLGSVEETIRQNAGDVAAIMLEPIPHNVGCIMPKQEFLEGLRRICDREGIVLIFDEVITGFRHHIGGYQSICKVTPDLTTMGKAIANGFPIAAIGGKKDMMQRFNTRVGGDVFFSGTFNGHSSCLAAALATIGKLEGGEVHKHIFRLGDKMRDGLRDIVKRNGYPCTVAGFGSVYTLYFMDKPKIENFSDLLDNDAELYVNYRRNLMKRGVFEIPMNLKRNHVSFSHTDADIDETLQIAEESLAATFDARARGEY
ncbi:MAG: aspartate aminotransferase family protein [Pseudomonadota bacterium]|nr:aspartate aminotransferase family protein [Pseudomonadota bacterium]